MNSKVLPHGCFLTCSDLDLVFLKSISPVETLFILGLEPRSSQKTDQKVQKQENKKEQQKHYNAKKAGEMRCQLRGGLGSGGLFGSFVDQNFIDALDQVFSISSNWQTLTFHYTLTSSSPSSYTVKQKI